MMKFKTWMLGLLSAVIGGVATSASMMVVDPATFNFSPAGLPHLGKLMAAGGATALFAYLKQSPIPKEL